MMCANKWILDGRDIVFLFLYNTPFHYHHYAELSEDIAHIQYISGIFCGVCLRLRQFYRLCFRHHMGLCVCSCDPIILGRWFKVTPVESYISATNIIHRKLVNQIHISIQPLLLCKQGHATCSYKLALRNCFGLDMRKGHWQHRPNLYIAVCVVAKQLELQGKT